MHIFRSEIKYSDNVLSRNKFTKYLTVVMNNGGVNSKAHFPKCIGFFPICLHQ